MDGYYASESERAVLSGAIIDGFRNSENPTVILKIVNDLKGIDFNDRDNRDLFQVMADMYKNGDPFYDAVAVNNEANRRKVLQGPQGFKYLSTIFENAVTAVGIDYHIREIKNARKRKAIAAFQSKIADMPVDGFMETAESTFLVLREKTADTGGIKTFDEITHEAFSALEKAKEGGGFPGVPSGFPSIDKYTGGWKSGGSIIVAGRPGMGKSDFAKDCSEAAGVPVLYFNLEMDNLEQANRHISGLCGVDFGRINTGKVTEDDCVKIVEGLNRKGSLPIFYNDKACMTIDEICSKSLGMKIRENIGLIIIDYLQLISPTQKLSIRQEEVSAISRRLKLLARELEIPVITLAQLNRKCEERSDKRPMLSDLRESGSLEQDADLVGFLYREHVYDETADENEAEFCISKHRNGPTGTIDLFFDGAHQKFHSMINREA